jgi:hypothetical protein
MDVQSAVYSKCDRLRNGNGHHSPTVTGRNLAHSHRTASQRAALAAQLVLEEVEQIKPTMIQAAAVTRVNIPYVQFALRLTPATRERVAKGELTIAEAAKANGLLAAWEAATLADKAALGSAVGVNEIWDRAIQPSI